MFWMISVMKALGAWERESSQTLSRTYLSSTFSNSWEQELYYRVSISYTGPITEPCQKESTANKCLLTDQKGLSVEAWLVQCLVCPLWILSQSALASLLSSRQLNQTLYCLFKRFIRHLRSFMEKGRMKGIDMCLIFTSKCKQSRLSVPWAPHTSRHLWWAF